MDPAAFCRLFLFLDHKRKTGAVSYRDNFFYPLHRSVAGPLKNQLQREREKEKAVRTQYRKKERLVLALGVCTLLGALACLKYYNFFAQNANLILEHAGQRGIFQVKTLLLPVGISFYTLQAISYMADVYWEKIRPQRHLGKLALFLGFFPQIMEGPISMYGQTGEALWKGEDLRGENLSAGCARILWGFSKR